MEHDNGESLHERIERLESVVEELQKTLMEANEEFERKFRYHERMTHEKPTYKHPLVQERILDLEPSPVVESNKNKTFEVSPRKITPRRSIEPISPSRTREEWEELIGGKLLNRIGAFALIIGIGFFLKYAVDNNWINETTRVIIGVIIGIGLLYGGARFHKKGLSIFAQGLVGAGIPILYLSVYASFNYYHLISQTTAFVLMSVVTIISFHQALKYDSFAVSWLGYIGGFLTPFLLNTGETNEIGLFTYIVLLDAGLIAILIRKPSWAILELLTLAATYSTYFIWYINSYDASKLPAAVVFLTLFWGLFYILDISRVIKPITTFPHIRQLVPSLNAVIYYLLLYVMINKEYHDWMAPTTLLIGVVYFLSFQWSQHRLGVNEGTSTRYVLTAIAMLIIATGIHFSGFILVAAWSLESLALVWYCSLKNIRYGWRTAIGVFVYTTIRLLLYQFPEGFMEYEPVEGIIFFFNRRTLAFIALAVSLGFSIAPIQHIKEDIIPKVKQILHYWWSAVLFVLCSVEIYDLFADQTLYLVMLMITLGWAIYSLAMGWPALRKKVEPILICSLCSLLLASASAATLGLLTFDPIEQFRFVLNVRVGIMAILLAGIYIQVRWYKNLWPDYQWREEIINSLQFAFIILLFSLITGETKDFFEKSIVFAGQSGVADVQNIVIRLANQKQLSLSGAWLIYSILLMGAGMWRRIQDLRIIAIALFGFTILKIFIYDLSFLDSLYRIISFIGLGVILLAVSYLYQQYKSIIFDSTVT